jgi:hypothetical protein
VARAADDHIPARARLNEVCAFGSDLVGTKRRGTSALTHWPLPNRH